MLDGVLLKDGLVALAFASGLIPSVLFANRQAASTLFDTISSTAPPSTDSPPLRSAPLLFYPAAPRVADVLAVVSRIDADALKKPPPRPNAAVWDNSQSLVAKGVWQPERPATRRLLRRADYVSRITSARSQGWPNDADGGGPAGGAELREALGGAGALRRRPLDSVAVDAVWVALSGGSSYVAPEELDRQLARWRPAPAQVRLGQFERALLQGRATIVGGYLVLFGLQALVLAVLVVGPLLERAS
eukprot:Transcript_5530.p2 GENE.Transcript_5530~~Transcript_5530.p2  ORF type:complete len:246 (-),score=73.31 Transcript_5530:18-755(-)